IVICRAAFSVNQPARTYLVRCSLGFAWISRAERKWTRRGTAEAERAGELCSRGDLIRAGRAMYQPEAYGIALLFMIGSMLCWGSWANTMKLTPGWAFQLFYWDYVVGILVGSLFWGLTLGSVGGGELSFLNSVRSADTRHILFAILGGAVFNVANLLLVAAIDIAGLAVAFPIGI